MIGAGWRGLAAKELQSDASSHWLKRAPYALCSAQQRDCRACPLTEALDTQDGVCLQVFEHMEMNLRELTRKVGVGCGIKIDAVAQLAFQMLVALKHLQARCRLIGGV